MEFYRGRTISGVRVGRLWVYAVHAKGERFRVFCKWEREVETVAEVLPFRPSVGTPHGWSSVSAPEV